MKCEEFEAHLNEILDERRRPEWDEQLRHHGERCRGCRELAAAYGVLFEGFFALAAPQAPADLATRVLDEIQIKPLISRRRLALVGVAFSTAAAVLVAVFLTRGGHQAQELAQAPAPAVNAPELPVQWTKLDDIPVVGPLLVTMNDLDHNADRYEELAKETGQGLASVVLRMPGVAGPRGVRPPGPPTLDGTGLWPLQVSEGLRPVRESVNETLNLLLKALPITFTAQTQPHAS